jgi:hypothetical protein
MNERNEVQEKMTINLMVQVDDILLGKFFNLKSNHNSK